MILPVSLRLFFAQLPVRRDVLRGAVQVVAHVSIVWVCHQLSNTYQYTCLQLPVTRVNGGAQDETSTSSRVSSNAAPLTGTRAHALHAQHIRIAHASDVIAGGKDVFSCGKEAGAKRAWKMACARLLHSRVA